MAWRFSRPWPAPGIRDPRPQRTAAAITAAASGRAWARPRSVWAAVGLAGGALFALAGWAAPELERAPALCALRLLFGLPCPACGLTRASAWLARGDLAHALRFHPLAPLELGELAALWGLWGLVLAGRARWPAARAGLALLWVNLAGLALVWLVRLASGSLPR